MTLLFTPETQTLGNALLALFNGHLVVVSRWHISGGEARGREGFWVSVAIRSTFFLLVTIPKFTKVSSLSSELQPENSHQRQISHNHGNLICYFSYQVSITF